MDYIEISTSTLFRAVSLAGGLAELARSVHVPQADLLAYAGSRHVMPQEVFLRLVDFVLDDAHFVKPLHAAGGTSTPRPEE